MKKYIFNILLLLLLMVPGLMLKGQDFLSDSAFFQKALSNTRSHFMQNMGVNSVLYNGTAYDHYWNRVSGSPFFLSDQMVQGKVFYNGNLYTNIPLAYDMLKDVLVTKNFEKNTDISLVKDQIEYFIINEHEFVRLDKDDLNKSAPKTGFYERLYNKEVKVYLRREKMIKQLQKAEDNLTGFVEYDVYYLQKNGSFFEVSGEADLLRICKDHRSEMRKFLNRKDMNYKKDPAKVIVQSVAYYVTLKNGDAQ